jgi:hypothetical protein
MLFIYQCIPKNTITIRQTIDGYPFEKKKTMRIRNRFRKRAQATKNESDENRFTLVITKIRNKV